MPRIRKNKPEDKPTSKLNCTNIWDRLDTMFSYDYPVREIWAQNPCIDVPINANTYKSYRFSEIDYVRYLLERLEARTARIRDMKTTFNPYQGGDEVTITFSIQRR